MNKSKLGISIGLLGAAVFFIGMINTLGLIVLAGYVLLCEESSWLKKAAVKAVFLTLVFSFLSIALSMGDNVFGILNIMIGWIPFNIFKFRLDYPFGIDTVARNGLYLLENLLFFILGLKALKQKSIKIGFIDKFIDKYTEEKTEQ